MSSIKDARNKLAFAEKALAHFAANPDSTTFTEGAVLAGAWFAVRWGIMGKSVIVFKIADDYDVYGPQTFW